MHLSNKNIFLSVVAALVIASGFIMQSLKPNTAGEHSFVQQAHKLKQMVSSYEQAAKEPWHRLQPRKQLQIGVTDEDVIALRKRLVLTGDLAQSLVNSTAFDTQLQQAVSGFQARHGLVPNGIVNKKTLAALNISPKKRLKQLQSNIKRWQEFENKQVSNFLWINIPEFQAQLIQHSKVTLRSSVIVGKPTHPTPEMYSEITDVMLNPYWIVPTSLVNRSIMPKIVQDASYIKKQKIHIFDSNNDQELTLQEIEALRLNQNSMDYYFKQEPGPRNPLGKIKYKITNSSSIYLHDTNAKEMFKQPNKALSSGCLRMQDPFNLFDKIMADESLVQHNDLDKIVQSSEPYNITLKKPFPIFITYFTAWVDTKGLVHFSEDIYNHDLG